MPRPGPRPYECVRRAWHSDRHQPIRGSIIQEIFRLANEVHSNATRKNKEWQEKLPFVVLKAEEIMYSKANSEAEYMDLKTLWDRANDAIDTIIRKDDANESGDLLQPCIEAALNLGCIPRRASRSQRHSNPVSYLSPNSKEPTDASPKPQHNSNSPNQLCSKSMLPPLLPIQSGNLHVPATQFGSNRSAMGPEIQFMLSNASEVQKRSLEIPINSFGATKPSVQSNGGKTSNLHAECDLSLRLGLPSPPSSEAESSWTHEVEDVGSSSSCDGGKSCGLLPGGAGAVNLESSLSSARDKGFDFFSAEHVGERRESSRKRCRLLLG